MSVFQYAVLWIAGKPARRQNHRRSEIESLEPRVVLTPPGAAASWLNQLTSEVNSEFGEAAGNSDQFFTAMTNDVASPLMNGPLSPLTSQFGIAAAGTIGSFQTPVNSMIGTGQAWFNNLSTTLAGWIDTPVAVTFDTGGGTWDVWSDPSGSYWGAAYQLDTPDKYIDFWTDASGQARLDAWVTNTTWVGTSQVVTSMQAAIERPAGGSIFGTAGFGHTVTDTTAGTQSTLDIMTSFDDDPSSGSVDNLYFQSSRTTSDTYLELSGSGTSGPGGNVLGSGQFFGEMLTPDTSFGIDATLDSTGLYRLDSAFRYAVANGEIGISIHKDPGGQVSDAYANFANSNGAFGLNVMTTPSGTFGGYRMIAELSGGGIAHSSGTFGPGVTNFGGTVILPVVTPNHQILMYGQLEYWEYASVVDPYFQAGMGVQYRQFNHNILNVSYTTITGPGVLNGMDPNTLNLFMSWRF
jgi:hypothetical protein